MSFKINDDLKYTLQDVGYICWVMVVIVGFVAACHAFVP